MPSSTSNQPKSTINDKDYNHQSHLTNSHKYKLAQINNIKKGTLTFIHKWRFSLLTLAHNKSYTTTLFTGNIIPQCFFSYHNEINALNRNKVSPCYSSKPCGSPKLTRKPQIPLWAGLNKSQPPIHEVFLLVSTYK